MNSFEEKLLRLKQELRATEDGDVAKALQMTSAAFSERKRRESFPVDRLFALQEGGRPALDVAYVLTGMRLQGHARTSTEATLRVSYERGDEELVRLAERAAQTQADEQERRKPRYRLLLDLADHCDEQHLELAVEVMKALRAASTHVARSKARPLPDADATSPKPERSITLARKVYNGPIENIAGRDVIHHAPAPARRKKP
jgi:hypothetical protein